MKYTIEIWEVHYYGWILPIFINYKASETARRAASKGHCDSFMTKWEKIAPKVCDSLMTTRSHSRRFFPSVIALTSAIATLFQISV